MKEILNADISLVELRFKVGYKATPHCKLHGAMNKFTEKGIWRCCSTYMIEQLNDNGKGFKSKFKANNCKAGCEFN